MRYFLLLSLIGLALAAPCGQAWADARALNEAPAPVQRRADLRQALKAAPVIEVTKQERAIAPTPNRQLSPKERTDLRNLLRNQGSEPRPEQRRAVP